MKKAMSRIVGGVVAWVVGNPVMAGVAGVCIVALVIWASANSGKIAASLQSIGSGGEPSPAAKGRVFEAFWYTVGREEGPCQWDKWTANDVGHGVSIGWIQFNQKSGLVYLLQNAARINRDAFNSIFGDRADDFANAQQIKDMDLNYSENKELLLRFLRSNFGKQMQIETAYQNYWLRANNYVDQHRPGASDEFRVIAGLLSVQFSPSLWQRWIRESYTAEEANAKAQRFMYAKGYNTIAKWRYPRQLANTRKALDGKKVCP